MGVFGSFHPVFVPVPAATPRQGAALADARSEHPLSGRVEVFGREQFGHGDGQVYRVVGDAGRPLR